MVLLKDDLRPGTCWHQVALCAHLYALCIDATLGVAGCCCAAQPEAVDMSAGGSTGSGQHAAMSFHQPSGPSLIMQRAGAAAAPCSKASQVTQLLHQPDSWCDQIHKQLPLTASSWWQPHRSMAAVTYPAACSSSAPKASRCSAQALSHSLAQRLQLLFLRPWRVAS